MIKPVRPIRELWCEFRARLADWWRRLLSVADTVAQGLVRWPVEVMGRVEVRSAKAGMALFGPLWRWLTARLHLRWIVHRVFYWWGTRRWSILLRGLPAVSAALAIAVGAALVVRDSPARQTRRYQVQAQLAWQRGDTDRAKLCLQRLALLNSGEPAHVFGLAHCEARLGNATRAWALMQSVAAADRPGYAPAHLWQAQQLMLRGHQSLEQLQLAERHLLGCLETQPQ